jgi:hypothetical protein
MVPFGADTNVPLSPRGLASCSPTLSSRCMIGLVMYQAVVGVLFWNASIAGVRACGFSGTWRAVVGAER